LFQDVLRVWHIHCESSAATASSPSAAGAASATSAAATTVPAATAAIHGDERARDHPDFRHCIRFAGTEAYLRRQNRLHYPLLHKGSAYRTYYLYHQHGAGAAVGTGISRLLSCALSALPLRRLDLDPTALSLHRLDLDPTFSNPSRFTSIAINRQIDSFSSELNIRFS